MFNTIFTVLALTIGSGETTKSVAALSDQSSIIWHAEKVTGDHTGTIVLKSGTLDTKGNQLDGGEFVIDMTTINTTDLEGEWKDKLDGHLKSDDFFGVEKFKTASLKITNVVKKASGYDVTGDFTIKGKTVSVTFPAQYDAKAKEATAQITLDRSKFDVRYGSNSFFDNLGDKAIYDEFTLDVKIVTE